MDRKLGSLFVRMRGQLARAVTSIVPPGDVEDVVQETYVRVCKASRLGELRAPRSYMLRTARNLALDHVKRAGYRLVDSLDSAGNDDGRTLEPKEKDTLEQVCSDEDFALFCAAVRELPLQCRRAFVLKKVYGYTQREVAEEMQISEKTVEGHIAKGITRCKRIVNARKSGCGGFDSKGADASGTAQER